MSLRNDFIKNNAVDARWFLQLKSIKRQLILNSYSIPNPIQDLEMKKMLDSKAYNPVFEYSNIDITSIRQEEVSLRNMRLQVLQEEAKESIRDAYINKLDEILTELQIIKSTQEKDYKTFDFLNNKLYGNLSKDIVSSIITNLQNRYHLLQDVPRDIFVDSLERVTQDTFNMAKVILAGPDIYAEADKIYSSNEIVSLWQEFLTKNMPGWSVSDNNSGHYMVVNSKERMVSIPSNLHISGSKVRKLFVHEIGTHVYRREEGKKHPFQLLSIGLARYSMAEEGLAIVREQLCNGSFLNYGGHDKYLALAYAGGYIDGEKKDFRTTFDFLQKYYFARLVKKHHGENAYHISNKRAWGTCVRIFRGGNPSIPGSCLLKDKIYREGNIHIWSLLEKSPESFKNIYAGKFDPGSEKHLMLVNKRFD